MRTLGVVTTSRADYGFYLPILRRIRDSRELNLKLLVTGMHLSPAFGLTVKTIEADGFEVAERVEMLLASDTPEAVSKSMGLGTLGFAQLFSRFRPDILVVLGDRFEMHAAAVASLPFNIPIAHIHGGEVTEGAMDDAFRHALTKMSHLHFVAAHEYGARVIRMGEEPWRVTVCGSPSLDNLVNFRPLSMDELEARVGMRLSDRGFLLVTFHPATREYTRADEQTAELLAAVEATGFPIVFTLPNADTGGHAVRERILAYAATHPTTRAVESLGTPGYFSLMARAAAMVGNSSSGLLEAPSFRLPVVNVGHRQRGRVRAANVLDVDCRRDDILAAVHRAIAPEFREGLAGLSNPYGDGRAADQIVTRLAAEPLGERLLKKPFYDGGAEGPGA